MNENEVARSTDHNSCSHEVDGTISSDHSYLATLGYLLIGQRIHILVIIFSTFHN